MKTTWKEFVFECLCYVQIYGSKGNHIASREGDLVHMFPVA